ncbi:MAG: BlaI/MecI/CopY family transcriptional regulator [Roseburia sp.]|nr:BlaI/MecI/CopY family transcriptional regulator [Roseburia sp.]
MGGGIVYETSGSERLIMEFLWEAGTEKSFVEIMEFLNNEAGKAWKKQTVNTFLKRLIDKGLIAVRQKGRNRAYCAAMTADEYEQGCAKKLLNDYYNGSIGAFLSALSGGEKIDKQFADELRRLVD